MRRITNPKISAFTSASGDCRGITVLFNHLGGHLTKIAPDIYRLRCQVREDPALVLYEDLFRAWERTTKEPAVRDLAPASIGMEALHVTAADVWYSGNLAQISDSSFQTELKNFLQGLPHSLTAGWPKPIESVKTLMGEKEFVIRFIFDRLQLFGEALVASLRPADGQSEAGLKLFSNYRAQLDELLIPYGRPANQKFTPHVTLSYFPDLESTQKAQGMLPRWQATFQTAIADHAIEFRSASVYAFTSMLDFYTRRSGPPALFITGSALSSDRCLAERGSRKVFVTSLYSREEFAKDDVWVPITKSGMCPVEINNNTEIAFFTEAANQDQHFHRKATEIYTVLQGGPMHIVVESREFAVRTGESIIVHPNAVHLVHAREPFVAQVVTINSGGVSDKFVVPQPPRALVELLTGRVPPLVPNVTFAAFRHAPKPSALMALLEEVVKILALRFGSAFKPYRPEWIHSTWIGLECLRRDSALYSVNLAANYREIKQPNFEEFVREARQQFISPVTLRYCGFSTCSCTDDEKQSWKCRKGSEFHSCGRSAHEGTLYAFPNNPVVLTGWPVDLSRGAENYPRTAYHFRRKGDHFGIVDKYHFRAPHDRWFWENDDCGITLGRLGDVPSSLVAEIVLEVRNLLGAPRAPIYVDIAADDLAVIKYNDTKLETCDRTLPLRELTTEELDSLYDDVGW